LNWEKIGVYALTGGFTVLIMMLINLITNRKEAKAKKLFIFKVPNNGWFRIWLVLSILCLIFVSLTTLWEWIEEGENGIFLSATLERNPVTLGDFDMVSNQLRRKIQDNDPDSLDLRWLRFMDHYEKRVDRVLDIMNFQPVLPTRENINRLSSEHDLHIDDVSNYFNDAVKLDQIESLQSSIRANPVLSYQIEYTGRTNRQVEFKRLIAVLLIPTLLVGATIFILRATYWIRRVTHWVLIGFRDKQ
jgi:hypothetical protein